MHDRIKDQNFRYLSVTLRKKVNMKLFLVISPHIVLFRFEAKCKPGLKLNLNMVLNPQVHTEETPITITAHHCSLLFIFFRRSNIFIRSISSMSSMKMMVHFFYNLNRGECVVQRMHCFSLFLVLLTYLI